MITDRKILEKLRKVETRYAAVLFAPVGTVPVEFAETTGHFRIPPTDEAGLRWRHMDSGKTWGTAWGTAWFRGSFRIPSDCRREAVFIRPMTGGREALVFLNGEPVGGVDSNHSVIQLTGSASTRRSYDVAIEAYAGHPCIGTQPDDANAPSYCCTFETVELLRRRDDVMGFVFDLRVLLSLVDALDAGSLKRGQLVAALAGVYDAVPAIPTEHPEPVWRIAIGQARQLMEPLLAMANGPTTPEMGIVGHSHIDTAWLWPLTETWRKCARTFSTMANLMEQYPEFIFTQSAPCHAEIMQREYPRLFRRMQKLVTAGRWEPNGGMYVEPDCNIPAGESLIRQFLIGQQTTRRLFSRESDAFWQPDVFGYSAALPQIMRGCGIDYFLTTKISWNDTTRFPYDTFWWRGIDGTAVLAHFNKTHCWPDPATLAAQFRDMQHLDTEDRRLTAFGYGDGGGGPQFEMLEIARRVQDLEGCPRARYTTVSDFMRRLETERGDRLPEYTGELYLELHRGTLTSLAQVKQGNRRAELALREAEFLCSLASPRGHLYPANKLRATWKKLLINQFHDILPGSSIPEVNDQAVQELGECEAEARNITENAARALFGKATSHYSAIMVCNSLSWVLSGELPLRNVPRGYVPADPAIVHQRVRSIEGTDLLVVAGFPVPPLACTPLELRRGSSTGSSSFRVTRNTVRTPHARIRFNRAGQITSLIDRASARQLVRAGGAFNVLWLGEDVPQSWDNWDIDFDQQRKMTAQERLLSRDLVAEGPLQLRMRCTYEIGRASTLTQDMVFHAQTPRIDFETVIDWHEQHTLLKAGFATDLLSAQARHEIQYGHVERPTHRNRPHERAQFEVCNHKWTDLSEHRCGVAVLNDAKYGVSVDGGEIRLTLLKSGTHPDPRGDAGRHSFSYALLPHGGFSAESVVRPAYQFNIQPTAWIAGNQPEAVPSLMQIDVPHVIVETIKWAETGDGVIVRLYEAERSGAWARIALGAPVAAAQETNMLEEKGRDLPIKNGTLELYFRPFEIKTLKMTLAG